MVVPKSFKLFATTINVVVDNQRTDDMKVFGCYEPHNNTIILADKFGIHNISEDQMLDTFYHEKVHAILRAMNEEELNNNEKFVDVFAKLLRQSDETATFKTNEI